MPSESRTAAGPSVALAAAIFTVHAVVRFGGLWQPVLLPVSMVLAWPLPWLLLDRQGRRVIGIRLPGRRGWLGVAGLSGLAAFLVCAVVAWLAFGETRSNWLVLHREMLHWLRASLPAHLSSATRFWAVTLPTLLVSPLGDEILYRGFLHAAAGRRWGRVPGLLLPAVAFAVVHLAHYGLEPVDFALIAVWIPSMFCFALLLGWLAGRYRSLAPPILAHATFNLALAWYALRLWPALAGH